MLNELFLIGSPRTGKSITSDILASSGKFAWISQVQKILPDKEIVSLFNRIYGIPKIGNKLYSHHKTFRFLPSPTETNNFWKLYLSEFENEENLDINESQIPRIKNEGDISKNERKTVRKKIKKICKWRGKSFFLSEFSKYPHITYLSQPFPDAKFVHVIRDGRAVAYEYSKMIKRGNYDEWNEKEWWIRGWPEKWRKQFKKKYDSILGFCAYQWKFFLKWIWKDASNVSDDRYMEITYENLVEQPKKTISEILNFTGLKYNSRLNRYLNQIKLTNMNYKWKENLSEDQKRQLDEIIHEPEYVELLED